MNCGDLKIGVALGSGFFRGIAHIGVLQVLKENDIPVHLVAGTSIGAVIGAIYATGMDLYRLEQLVYACNERMFYDVGLPRQGFIKGEKIMTFLRTVTGDKTFDKTVIPFAAVACDIETGEKVVLKEGKICEAVRASLSIPGVFVPVRLGNRLLVDGGVRERVPASVTREMGADVVIAVDVGVRDGTYPVHSTIEIIMRALELMEYNTIATGLPADVLLTPDLFHINKASLAQAEECLLIGRKAAQAKLDDIFLAIEKAQKEKKKEASA